MIVQTEQNEANGIQSFCNVFMVGTEMNLLDFGHLRKGFERCHVVATFEVEGADSIQDLGNRQILRTEAFAPNVHLI